MTQAQIIEVDYEGQTRRFSVCAVSVARATPVNPIQHLTDEFKSLDVSLKLQIWTVDWDSSVRIVENKPDQKPDVLHHKVTFATVFLCVHVKLTLLMNGSLKLKHFRAMRDPPLTSPLGA